MEETKRVGRSLLILLAALLLVYVVFFDVRGNVAYTNTISNTSSLPTASDIDRLVYIDRTRQLSNNAYSDDIYYDTSLNPNNNVFANPTALPQAQDTKKDPIIVQNNSQSSTTSNNSLPAVVEDLQGRKFYSTDFLFGRTGTDDTTNVGTTANPVGTQASRTGQTEPQTIVTPPAVPTSTPVATINQPNASDQIILADTRVWDKTMPLMQTLQLTDQVEYVLKDMNNTHYVYLGKYTGDIKQIVSFLGGSSIDITNQISIQNSQLFGKQVTEITLPSYKNNLKKLMLVTFANGDAWFVQIDRDRYASLQNKLEIQENFEEFY